MDKYRRVEKTKNENETPAEPNEVRITQQGKVRSYITYANALLTEKNEKVVVLKAMGQAINKAVSVAEVLKLRVAHLHQITHSSSVETIDVYEPLEEGLDRIETKRFIPSITIQLSLSELDTSDPGYQPPLPLELVTPFSEEDKTKKPKKPTTATKKDKKKPTKEGEEEKVNKQETAQDTEETKTGKKGNKGQGKKKSNEKKARGNTEGNTTAVATNNNEEEKKEENEKDKKKRAPRKKKPTETTEANDESKPKAVKETTDGEGEHSNGGRGRGRGRGKGGRGGRGGRGGQGETKAETEAVASA